MLNKVILVSATWCCPCKAYGPVFESTMKNEFPDVEWSHVDVESKEGEELSEKYNIMSVPVTLFIDENNELMHKELGNIGKDNLSNKIRELRF